MPDDDILDTSPEKMARARNARLARFLERIENVEAEKKALSDDIREIYAEAKAAGYDPKVMRFVLRLRKMETHTRQEWDASVEAYRDEVGLS